MSRKKGRDEVDQPEKARRTLTAAEVAAEEEYQRMLRASEEDLKNKRRARRTEVPVKDDAADSDDDKGDGWEDCSSSDEGVLVDDGVDEASEEIIDNDDADDDYAEFQNEAEKLTKQVKSVKFSTSAGGDDGDDDDEEQDEAATKQVWRNDLAEDAPAEKLSYSNKAYDSFFQLQSEYPCLSFDILQDNDGNNRSKYPLHMFLVCGSQADEQSKNMLYVIKVSNVCRTKHDVDSDEDSEDSFIGDDESEESGADDDGEVEEVNNGEPLVDFRTVKHHGTANRVRCSKHNKHIVAVWSDAGHIQVFDVDNDFSALADFANWSKEQERRWNKSKPVALKFCSPSSSHTTEGYALDWSPTEANVFASGDCAGDIFVWKPTSDGRWSSEGSARRSNDKESVEEIKWSPVQSTVFVAGRMGGMLEVWDTRDMRKPQVAWRGDELDINVADWNHAKQASHLLVTGSDSGVSAVWDLRRVTKPDPAPIQELRWHKRRITSVEFSAQNESVLCATGDDGQCTIWDLSLERDASEEKEAIGQLFERPDLSRLPDQLMFQHQGLEHPKEAHWHPQIPGMVLTTDFNGLHLFKPMNWRSLMK